MALLLHVIVFGSMIVAFDFRARTPPDMPLVLTARIVTDTPPVAPPVVEERPEPPAPEPDTSEQDRIRAEEQKRLEEARVERERLSRIEKAKQEAEAERQRKADEARRLREEEARKEAARLEAERQRQAEIERQRQENERLRAEAEAARRAEIDAESSRLEAMQADARQRYMFRIKQRIMSRWAVPASATPGVECVANIIQAPGGEVISFRLGRCNGDDAVRRSIEAAIKNASPLPMPDDPRVFEREVRITFRPEEQN